MSANPSRESGDMQTTDKTKQYLMTEGPIHQRVLRYAIPVFIGYLFQQLYNTADALIVGNLVGRNALAAVTSTGSIVYLAVGTFTGFSMGAGIVIARYIGAEDSEKTSQTVHTAVAMGLFFSVLFTALGVLFSPVILRAMGTPEDVFTDAALYLKIYFAGCTGLVMYNIFVGILQASGDSTHPLYYLITSSVINVVLDITLIGVFHMGVDGAAIATIVSQGIAALLVMIRLLRQSGDIRISFSKIGFHWRRLREIVLFGLPTAVQNTVIDFSNVLIQSYINSFSAAAMAGIGAYSKVEGFAFLPVTAFSMAMATFISQNIGAGRGGRRDHHVPLRAPAGGRLQPGPQRHRLRGAPGQGLLLVLLPAGLFPCVRRRVPGPGQAHGAHAGHADLLVRRPGAGADDHRPDLPQHPAGLLDLPHHLGHEHRRGFGVPGACTQEGVCPVGHSVW